MAFKEKQKAVAYNNSYNKANYDRINLTIPKGEKDRIKAHSEALGESVNAFVYRAIKEAMEHDTASNRL